MPKYMLTGTYTPESMKGVAATGAAARVAAMSAAAESVDGTLDSMFWTMDLDAVGVFDLPDDAAMFALCATGYASGAAVAVKTERVLTADEVDAALGASVAFRAPS